jgi:hypothetical protein
LFINFDQKTSWDPFLATFPKTCLVILDVISTVHSFILNRSSKLVALQRIELTSQGIII